MQKTKLLLNILALFLCILPAVSMAQGGGNVTVSGIVTSADDKQPLIGVNVISGATSGVSTLADGTYRITVSAGTTLTFQYIGYKPFEFTVPAGRSSVTCDVALQGDSQTLDDVVVIAYGVRKKGTIAGSVSTVKAEKIEDTPAAAFDQALQGQVPGLTVLSDSGEPSETAAMAIRGTNSINSGTAPLYILDGVAISSRDFNTINPSDIESLSVLKDASSTSIYGARAANGVIVITTKRGRMADRAKINYRMQLGFSQIAYGNWDLMNTSERIQYEKELGLTDGKNYNVLAKTDVNWLDEVFSNAALLQNYELSVSGASEKTNYYVSGGYYSQDGTAVGSSFERYSIRANVEQRAAKWLKLGTNTMMNYQTIEKADDGEYTLTTPISAARFMLPYWNPHRADGSLASVNDGSWKGEGQNPLEWLKNNPVDYKKYKIISTVFAEATPIEGLTLRSQFGVDYSHSTGRGISYPSYAPNLGSGTVQRNSSDGMSLSVTNTITYRFDIDNKHMFTFLAGQEGLDYRYEAFSLQTKDQNNDKLVNISSSPRATRWNDTTDDNYAYLSFFGRAEYSYSDRYYADFSLRTDGSSRFGASNRWAGFWSVGFMWNLRNE
ncbi:SusC/RagA family TonB-linked outer membrane protein, partial [Alistipes finegoldii]